MVTRVNVDDFVVVKAPGIHKIQQDGFCKLMILRYLRQVESAVPNQIVALIEVC
jgi:hypothetical protein